MKKVISGIFVALAYLGAFVFMETYQWGILPLFAVTMFFGWLFYKATGLDPLNVTIDREAEEQEDIQNKTTKETLDLTALYKKWRKPLFAFLSLSIAVSLFIFLRPQKDYNDCVLKYAIKAKSKIATHFLYEACYDLYEGSAEERKIYKCIIKHVSRANNDRAAVLAKQTCEGE